jgi:formate dehydrogenase subunit gamma
MEDRLSRNRDDLNHAAVASATPHHDLPGSLTMKRSPTMKRARSAGRDLLVAALLFAAAGAFTPACAQQQQQPSGANPTASSVNEDTLFKQSPKIGGRVTIPDDKAAILEQPQGREWHAFHERYLPWIGGIAVLGMLALLLGFFLWKGRIRYDRDEVSGRKILRFNAFERFTHWLTSSCFILLALSGLNYIFGKRLIMPLIGADAFGTLSQWGKYAHNFLAWPFMLGILFMLAVWLKDNLPTRVDWAWLKSGGGFFNGSHPSAWRFNAGQKMMFWIVAIGGIAMSVTGVIMLFPFSVVDVNGMQLMQIIHSVIGVLFIAAILAHIYIGSVGSEGAYAAMSTGEVDLAWAHRHHDLWVEQQQAKTASGAQLPRGTAPAE